MPLTPMRIICNKCGFPHIGPIEISKLAPELGEFACHECGHHNEDVSVPKGFETVLTNDTSQDAP